MSLSEQSSVKRRSSMFFESDLLAAADQAAFDMEDHGLDADEVAALAFRVENAIRVFFRERDNA